MTRIPDKLDVLDHEDMTQEEQSQFLKRVRDTELPLGGSRDGVMSATRNMLLALFNMTLPCAAGVPLEKGALPQVGDYVTKGPWAVIIGVVVEVSVSSKSTGVLVTVKAGIDSARNDRITCHLEDFGKFIFVHGEGGITNAETNVEAYLRQKRGD